MAGKVLIVNDDSSFTNGLLEVLGKHPVEVATARDVESANALLDDRAFSGVVVGSEIGVLRHIEEKGIGTPIVVVSRDWPSNMNALADEQVKLVFREPVEARVLGAIVLGLCGIAP